MYVSNRNWQDNINKDIKDIVCEGLDSIHQTQDSFQWQVAVNTIMNPRLSQKARNFLPS
jgi:hypothetical protein